MANDFRPLGAISRAMCAWARRGNVQTTARHSGRIRTAIDNLGIALGWMARGYQYDTRTFAQRMTDKAARPYLRVAVRSLFRAD